MEPSPHIELFYAYAIQNYTEINELFTALEENQETKIQRSDSRTAHATGKIGHQQPQHQHRPAIDRPCEGQGSCCGNLCFREHGSCGPSLD